MSKLDICEKYGSGKWENSSNVWIGLILAIAIPENKLS